MHSLSLYICTVWLFQVEVGDGESDNPENLPDESDNPENSSHEVVSVLRLHYCATSF